jgi:hypothetical protein
MSLKRLRVEILSKRWPKTQQVEKNKNKNKNNKNDKKR